VKFAWCKRIMGTLCARDQICRNRTRIMEGTRFYTRSPGSRKRKYGSVINKCAETKHQTYISLASIVGFKIWTQDLNKSYLQSAGTLAREVFIDKPAPELELSRQQALKLLRNLYGLADSGDFCHHELSMHHRNMSMKHLTTDNSAWIRLTNNVLEGISGVYVDDVVQAGTTAFDILTDSSGSTYVPSLKNMGTG
jgi:hypothetical protein